MSRRYNPSYSNEPNSQMGESELQEGINETNMISEPEEPKKPEEVKEPEVKEPIEVKTGWVGLSTEDRIELLKDVIESMISKSGWSADFLSKIVEEHPNFKKT